MIVAMSFIMSSSSFICLESGGNQLSQLQSNQLSLSSQQLSGMIPIVNQEGYFFFTFGPAKDSIYVFSKGSLLSCFC